MKLASFDDGSRDGCLCVVSANSARFARADGVAKTLQSVLDNWDELAPRLLQLFQQLESDAIEGTMASDVRFRAPLPRAYQWLDGSAYLSHSTLFRQAQGKPLPERYLTTPLMYQGGSDKLLGPTDPIEGLPAWGIDCEAEVGVIVRDVPMGVDHQAALDSIVLVVLLNDVSLRALQGAERETGFGWLQCKPSTAFAPFAVTPAQLGHYWHRGVLKLPVEITVNHTLLGRPDAGTDLQFDFGKLIMHAARTRALGAGTILGSGTISNRDVVKAGVACIAEQRYIETIRSGEPLTSFLQPGDQVAIEARDQSGVSVFGRIEQKVVLARTVESFEESMS